MDTDYHCNILDSLRDEFIYTRVFNNDNIPTENDIDLRLGTVLEWGDTCRKFNNGSMILKFATIYIVYNKLICNNNHPFKVISHLTNLLSAHVIHNKEIREGGNKYC
jgi:hypothetical protein